MSLLNPEFAIYSGRMKPFSCNFCSLCSLTVLLLIWNGAVSSAQDDVTGEGLIIETFDTRMEDHEGLTLYLKMPEGHRPGQEVAGGLGSL